MKRFNDASKIENMMKITLKIEDVKKVTSKFENAKDESRIYENIAKLSNWVYEYFHTSLNND